MSGNEGDVRGTGAKVEGDQFSLRAGGKGERTLAVTSIRGVKERRGRRMRVSMASGARIEATMIEASAQGLAVWVTKTSDRKAQPKGIAVLPKEQVRRFEMVEEKGRSVKVATLAGFGAGAAIGAGIAQATPEEGIGIVVVPVAAVAVAAIGTAVGYSIGRAMRWKVTEVTVAP